jgi:hypothetical protein
VIVPTLPNAILLLLLGGAFIHFVIAGGRTFYFVANGNELAGIVGEVLFYGTGTGVTWWMGIHRPIPPANQLAAALVLLSSSRCTSGRAALSGKAIWPWVGEPTCRRRCATAALPLHPPSHLPELRARLSRCTDRVATLDHDGHIPVEPVVFADCACRDERGIAPEARLRRLCRHRQRTGMFLPKFRVSRQT